MKDRYTTLEPRAGGKPGRSHARTRKGGRTSAAKAASLAEIVREHGPALAFLGITLGAFVSRKFFVVPAAVAASYLFEIVQDVVETR